MEFIEHWNVVNAPAMYWQGVIVAWEVPPSLMNPTYSVTPWTLERREEAWQRLCHPKKYCLMWAPGTCLCFFSQGLYHPHSQFCLSFRVLLA